MARLSPLFARIDPFLAGIVATVTLASLVPARGGAATVADWATNAAVALLFFLHGAQLSPQAALAGARHWRLHAVVLLSTFTLFPLIGVSAHALAPHLLSAPLWAGVLLVTILPSTIQASIAFTSVAGGNVPAALCSASASNVIGIVLTPLIAGFVLSNRGVNFSGGTVLDIVVQLLAPFVAGQLLQPWIGAFTIRRARTLKLVDYGSILLIVYSAFSHGVVSGIWHQVDFAQLVYVALQEEPGEWASDSQCPICRPRWPCHSAGNAVPPDPAHGVCHTCEALCRAPLRRSRRQAAAGAG